MIWSQAGLIGDALFYALFAWACAAGITFAAYVAISDDDLRDLLFAAFVASAPAMWFVPAILLLSTWTPEGALAGLLLIANITRLLVSRIGSRRRARARSRNARPVPERLFRYVDGYRASPAVETLPAVLGAFALQFGLCAIWAGYPLASGAFIAAAAGIWTWSSMARGAYRGRKRGKLWRSLSSIALTLLLTVTFSAGQFEMDAETASEPGTAEGILGAARRVLQRLAQAPAPRAQVANQSPAAPGKEAGVAGKDGVPGVILRPESRPRQPVLTILASKHLHFSLAQPLTIPFSGEYHLFLTSSGHPQADAVVHVGTPLEEVYKAMVGGSMETEAYQQLDPPIDFRNCGKVRLTLVSGENYPASASMQLVMGSRVEDLGQEIFGLDRVPEETLEFVVPPSPGGGAVTAIRVLFQRNPMERNRSTKVMVKRFTLIPAGL